MSSSRRNQRQIIFLFLAKDWQEWNIQLETHVAIMSATVARHINAAETLTRPITFGGGFKFCSWSDTARDVRPHRFLVQLNPPFRDQIFLSRAILPQISQKNERSIRPKFKKHENTTVLNKQKTHHLRVQMLAELSIGIV